MTDLIFDRWVLGGAPGHGLRHAVRRISRSVDGPFPGSYIVIGMCRIRGTYGLRATNTPFDPASLHSQGRGVCSECERRWAAEQEPIPGWTRTCATCAREQPINLFGVDKRTRDGMTKSCTPCVDGARQAVAAAQRIAAQAAETEHALTREARASEHRLETLRRYQDSSLTPTLRCTAGHDVQPVPATLPAATIGRFAGVEFPGEGLECPCGTAVLAAVGARSSTEHPAIDWSEIFRAVSALDALSASPMPTPVPIAAAAESQQHEENPR